MILNWKIIFIGFIVTLMLYTAGASLGHISILKGLIYTLAPIIGGFIVVYINDIDYIANIINGAISSGLAGFAAAFIISGLIEPTSVSGGYLGLLIVIIVIQAVMAFVIGAVLGLVGGIVGIIIKGQDFGNKGLS
jgi:hypothetical protein